MTRHWCINGRFLAQPLTGVQRYAREIVTALDDLVKDGHPLARDLNLTVLAPKDAKADLPLQAIPIRRVGISSGYAWEQFVLPAFVDGGLISLGNVGPVGVRHQIVCIHDTIARDWPQSYSWPFRISQRVLQGWLGRSARRVVTVSDHAAERLLSHRICDPDKIMVATNGYEHTLRWNRQQSAAVSTIDRRTILVLGTPAPHKNVRMLIEAAPSLQRHGLRLALVGAADDRIFRPDVGDRDSPGVTWLGRLTDGELAAALPRALCLAFPSLHEGFGLPVLEALAVGCPVVASTAAGLPTLCGGAGLCVPPDRPDLWIEAFLSLASDHALRERKRELGSERALAFSWRRSAENYLRAMAAADDVRPRPEAGVPGAGSVLAASPSSEP